MNEVVSIQNRLLIALVIDAHRTLNEFPSILYFNEKFNINAELMILNSAVTKWQDAGYVSVSRTLDGNVYVGIKRSSFADALSKVLEILDADILKADWKKEEIMTDAEIDDNFPAPEGWKVFTLPKSGQKRMDSTTVSQPVIINNNFEPKNIISHNAPQPKSKKPWLEIGGLIVAIVGVVVSLWIAGKI